ncbi:site-specific integrase, partial [Salinisphaera sp. RV14]|uniref:site-specific integrase n=1 Tax=Salinisphaera sp. RV14 TaxID=3454140 RepID=UPI003F8605B5
EITKADILAFRAEVAQCAGRSGNATLSPKTINNLMGVLNMIMTEAADRFEFPNPVQNIKRLRLQRKDIQPFSLDEVRLILDTVRSDFKPYYTLRFFTGMRTGELHGLKWSRIDWQARQILVRETVDKGLVDYTKTDGSQREIAMSSVVYDALCAQHQATGEGEYVFVTRDGTPLDTTNVTQRVWYPLLRYLELAPRRPYHCRHTAATLWLAAGENPEWIARQMGHTTTEMLFRVYSRYVPNL